MLRSGKMNAKTGVVVSLGTNAVDIVIGTPPTAQFLQRTEDAKFLFRVYTRFALRIRDKEKPPVRRVHDSVQATTLEKPLRCGESRWSRQEG